MPSRSEAITSGEYGLDDFTVNELQASLLQRPIITPLRALRTLDDKQMFPFLKLPPEIRNQVYSELFALHPSKWHSLSKKCHPAILATSKQVNREAAGYLNNDALTELSFTVRWRHLGLGPSGERNMYYGLDTELNGFGTFTSQDKERDIVVRWPQLLRQATVLKVSIDLQPRTLSWPVARAAAPDTQINSALHQLHVHLSRYCQATAFKIEISTSTSTSDHYFQWILSPLRALSGLSPNTTFVMPSLSQEKKDELQHAATGFCQLRKMQEEVDLALGIASYQNDVMERRLADYNKLLMPSRGIRTQMYIYASGQKLHAAIQVFDGDIEHLSRNENDTVPAFVRKQKARLLEVRMKREQTDREGESEMDD